MGMFLSFAEKFIQIKYTHNSSVTNMSLFVFINIWDDIEFIQPTLRLRIPLIFMRGMNDTITSTSITHIK